MKLMINSKALKAVEDGTSPTNTVVARTVSAEGHWNVYFVATDEETGAIRYAKNGEVILNGRAQRRRT